MTFRIFALLNLLSSLAVAHGFTPETLVKTPSGHEQIKNIRVGDEVMSCDAQKRCVPAQVLAVGHREVDSYLEIDVNGETLSAAPDQQFYIAATDQWVEAKALDQSVQLTNRRNQLVPIRAVRSIEGPKLLVYLSVDKQHNYYVGLEETLAHNFVFLLAIPVIAWGAGGLVIGTGAAISATSIALAAGGLAAGIAGGFAINEIAKHSNTPFDPMSHTLPLALPLQTVGDVRHFARADNNLRPRPGATEQHRTEKPSKTGNPKDGHWAEWIPNPRNPTGFDQGRRYDGSGEKPEGHFNTKTKEWVKYPHVHDPKTPGGVRAPTPDEIPK